MITKEPVTLSGWYELTDGRVQRFQWLAGRLVDGAIVGSWAEVPSTPIWDDAGFVREFNVVAVDRDGTIWGLGQSEDTALANANVWLNEGRNDQPWCESCEECTLHTVSVEQARMVIAGEVSWARVQAGPK